MDSLALLERPKAAVYPSPPACALYLPGYPPGGSTIYDQSNVFYDSGINTAEALDDVETGIDCTPDATTAIPVGSVIRIESEQMLVSATGLTLTVSRGYNGTTPATHVTATDIYRLTTNHGTILGATWARLPSGLWHLSFDGIDNRISVPHNTSIDIATEDFSYGCWANPTADKTLFRTMMWKTNSVSPFQGWNLFLSATDGFLHAVIEDEVANALNLTNSVDYSGGGWRHFFVTVDRDSATGMNLYVNGAVVATGDPTSVGTLANSNSLYIGIARDGTSHPFGGYIALQEVVKGEALSATKVLQRFNGLRRLFGV